MGADPLETALVEMWERMSEFEGLAGGRVSRSATPSAASPAARCPEIPGELAQIPELIERGRQRAAVYFDKLDARLGEARFLAGDRFTVADITALVHRRLREVHRDRGRLKAARTWRAGVTRWPGAESIRANGVARGRPIPPPRPPAPRW